MRILIFGGSSFVGKNLANYLFSKGERVVIFSRSAPKDFNNIKFIQWDFDQELTKNLVKVGDIAIHLAHDANNPEKTYAGTIKCISTLSVFGIKKQFFISSYFADKKSSSRYGAVKYKIESKIKEASNIIIIRPGLIIGNGGMYNKIEKCLNSSIFYPIFISEYLVPVVQIETICDQIYIFIKNKKNKKIINLFNVQLREINTIISEIVLKNRKNKIPLYLPLILIYLLTKIFKFFPSILPVSIDSLRSLIENQRSKKISFFYNKKLHKPIKNPFQYKHIILEYFLNGLFFSAIASITHHIIYKISHEYSYIFYALLSSLIYLVLSVFNFNFQKAWIFNFSSRKPSLIRFFLINLFCVLLIYKVTFITQSKIENYLGVNAGVNFSFFISLMIIAPISFLLQSFWTFNIRSINK